MNNQAVFEEWNVQPLYYVEFADAGFCRCGSGNILRWTDGNGDPWCEKCVSDYPEPWREVFPTS